MSTRNFGTNSLAGFNVTSLALEIPAACLTNGSDPVIGAYTTASLRQASVLNPTPQSAKSVGQRRSRRLADRTGIGRRRLEPGLASRHAPGE